MHGSLQAERRGKRSNIHNASFDDVTYLVENGLVLRHERFDSLEGSQRSVRTHLLQNCGYLLQYFIVVGHSRLRLDRIASHGVDENCWGIGDIWIRAILSRWRDERWGRGTAVLFVRFTLHVVDSIHSLQTHIQCNRQSCRMDFLYKMACFLSFLFPLRNTHPRLSPSIPLLIVDRYPVLDTTGIQFTTKEGIH